jgi:hypothetical protein
MEVFLNPNAWIALLTLTFLEIVLGIDNIIFISIATGKLPVEQRKRATKIGMFLAMFMRIALLLGISVLIAMKEPWFSFDQGWISAQVSGQSLILLLGGLFLIYKSTKEIHEKVDEKGEEEKELKKSAAKSFDSCWYDKRCSRCNIYNDYCSGYFCFNHDAVCCSSWKFRQQTSFYSNSWIVIFNPNRVYVGNRKCPFSECFFLWKSCGCGSKRLSLFCDFIFAFSGSFKHEDVKKQEIKIINHKKALKLESFFYL